MTGRFNYDLSLGFVLNQHARTKIKGSVCPAPFKRMENVHRDAQNVFFTLAKVLDP